MSAPNALQIGQIYATWLSNHLIYLISKRKIKCEYTDCHEIKYVLHKLQHFTIDDLISETYFNANKTNNGPAGQLNIS